MPSRNGHWIASSLAMTAGGSMTAGGAMTAEGRDESEGARRQRGARRRRGAMTTYLGHCEAEGRGNPWLSPMSRLCQKGAWASAHGRVGAGRAEGLAFEGGELVAQPCGLLEFEVAGVFEHGFFKPFDLTHQILLA